MTKERIEDIRQSLIPFVKKELLEINYDGLGKSDATEFEKDLNEVLDLASKTLERQPSDDCVSRADMLKKFEDRFIELQKAHQTDMQLGVNWCINTLKDMPPVTPTFPKGATNGDIIKAMFPNEVFKEISEYIEGQQVVSIFWKKSCMCFDVDWWNAPYKRGSEE